MIIEMTYRAESKKERQALQRMHLDMQEAGVEVVEFTHEPEVERCSLTVRQARRRRSGTTADSTPRDLEK